MKKNTAKNVTVNALSIALVCIATMAIQIPIPLGYMHLGNTCILLVAALFGPVTGLLAGGIGSALADMLTGYAQWIIPTLIIKSIMGFAIGAIAIKRKQSSHGICQNISRISGRHCHYDLWILCSRSHHEWQYLYRMDTGAGTDIGRRHWYGNILRNWTGAGKSQRGESTESGKLITEYSQREKTEGYTQWH